MKSVCGEKQVANEFKGKLKKRWAAAEWSTCERISSFQILRLFRIDECCSDASTYTGRRHQVRKERRSFFRRWWGRRFCARVCKRIPQFSFHASVKSFSAIVVSHPHLLSSSSPSFSSVLSLPLCFLFPYLFHPLIFFLLSLFLSPLFLCSLNISDIGPSSSPAATSGTV